MDILDDTESTHTSIYILTQVVSMLLGYVLFMSVAQFCSYEELPPHLKPCFLYFGVFLEDFEFSTRQLIRLWIAGGFIEQDKSRKLEDVAEEYMEDLVDRSLIMVAPGRCDGGVKSCFIHDLLHDLCISEGIKENFLGVHTELLTRYLLHLLAPQTLLSTLPNPRDFPFTVATLGKSLLPLPDSSRAKALLQGMNFSTNHIYGEANQDYLANVGVKQRRKATFTAENLPRKLVGIVKVDRVGIVSVRRVKL
ncbi:hypothetical protein LguiB_017054 [Lonicera macranthoides]